MRIKATSLSESLRDWLEKGRDHGQSLLVVHQRGDDIEVLRADGAEPSADEHFEVFCRVAAHAVDPCRPPTSRRPSLEAQERDAGAAQALGGR